MIPIANQNGISLNLHYIIQEQTSTSSPDGSSSVSLSSLHGPAELEEDLRQVCIQKYFPDRFLDYLLEHNKNFQSSLWDQTASQVLGDDSVGKIRTCVTSEAKELILQNAQLTQELNIHTSPTVLWENQYRFNNLKELKQNVAVFSGIEIKEGGCGQ